LVSVTSLLSITNGACLSVHVSTGTLFFVPVLCNLCAVNDRLSWLVVLGHAFAKRQAVSLETAQCELHSNTDGKLHLDHSASAFIFLYSCLGRD
jgi:Na+/serine symporter